eukprot:TRINITY_DN103619_c0_g1_i1.p1 TRINITY_DN103619_c0_g1~~TRINITY_DN103619_c0_g1_i1.p1  ORF type:complete len:339 (-),score=83.88 TRINITY_DN103619_c0_g1_i1:37-1053(-)
MDGSRPFGTQGHDEQEVVVKNTFLTIVDGDGNNPAKLRRSRSEDGLSSGSSRSSSASQSKKNEQNTSSSSDGVKKAIEKEGARIARQAERLAEKAKFVRMVNPQTGASSSSGASPYPPTVSAAAAAAASDTATWQASGMAGYMGHAGAAAADYELMQQQFLAASAMHGLNTGPMYAGGCGCGACGGMWPPGPFPLGEDMPWYAGYDYDYGEGDVDGGGDEGDKSEKQKRKRPSKAKREHCKRMVEMASRGHQVHGLQKALIGKASNGKSYLHTLLRVHQVDMETVVAGATDTPGAASSSSGAAASGANVPEPTAPGLQETASPASGASSPAKKTLLSL